MRVLPMHLVTTLILILFLAACEVPFSKRNKVGPNNQDVSLDPELLELRQAEQMRAGDEHSRFVLHSFDFIVDQAEWEALNRRDPEFRKIKGQLEFSGQLYTNVEIKAHGSGSAIFPKKSFRIKVKDKPMEAALFSEEVEKVERLLFSASWNDRTFLRHKLTFDAVREMLGLAPRVSYGEVRVNGAYFGLFALIERVHEGFLNRHGMSVSGSLYKAGGGHQATWAHRGGQYIPYYEPKLDSDPEGKDLGELFQTIEQIRITETDLVQNLQPRLDLYEYLLWQAVNTYIHNYDSYTNNYYLYRSDVDANARFRLIHWDVDESWGMDFGKRKTNYDVSYLRGRDELAKKIFLVEPFCAAYRKLYLDMIEAQFSATKVVPYLQAWGTVLKPAVDRDQEKWHHPEVFDDALAFLTTVAAEREASARDILDNIDHCDVPFE